MSEFSKHLSRRFLTISGWTYFCRICGDYKPENQFYSRKNTPFRIDTRCKIHYKKKQLGDDTENTHLNFGPLREQDFIDTQKLLERIGYKFGPDQPSVYNQFIKKYNL